MKNTLYSQSTGNLARIGNSSRNSRNNFNASSSINDRVIPRYDSKTDQYCPYTRTANFQRHLERYEKLDKIDNPRRNRSNNRGLFQLSL